MKKALLVAGVAAMLVFAFVSTAFAATAITATTPNNFRNENGNTVSIAATFTASTESSSATLWRVRVAKADGTTMTAGDLALLSGTLNSTALTFDNTIPYASNPDTFAANAVVPAGALAGPQTLTANIVLGLGDNTQYAVTVSFLGATAQYKAASAINFEMFEGIAAAPAGSTQPASNIAANGAAVFSYKDLLDGAAKTEGGYAAFDAGSLYASNGGLGPHGGYATTTNKCKVCHAVHRAEGAYYLLRADSQDDACDYCHIGGSAHSAKVVYDLNAAGTATTNGHTIGAQSFIPDSTTKQVAQAVTISSTDANGDPISAVINVRSYEAEKNEMFRLTRHHAQSPVGTGRSGWKKVGPYALRCMNCHQPHNAVAQIWQPATYGNDFVDGAALKTGYKLLRRYPSGSTVGQANQYGMFDAGQAVKVPETTLTADVNYSTEFSGQKVYTENGATAAQPIWVAQGWDPYEGTGPSEDPATVNQYTLSVWCADCHNLNIGGQIELGHRGMPEELGFKAHTERTHPAPFVGAHSGPGQCYSCHRNDLSVQNNKVDPAGYGSGQPASPKLPASDSCTQCHYGTQAYAYDHAEAANYGATATRDSDFPHSGKATDIKMLGSYSTNIAAEAAGWTPVYSFSNVSETNLDAVCIRCHPGIGVHN